MFKSSIFLAFLVFLLACNDQKKSPERPSTPRIRKETKVVTPKQNQQFVLGQEVPVEVTAGEGIRVDSIVVEVGGVSSVFTESTFSFSPSSGRVGALKMKLTVHFDGKKETHYPKVAFLPETPPEEASYTIVNTYPHDTQDYIQGLLIDGNFLYESTGREGYSTLEKKNIESGETLVQINLPNSYFGEGLALINDEFYQLTYTSGACFVYNRDLEQIRSYTYQGEGWGLCEYEGRLLMTNGSERIFIRDPRSFSIVDELEVYDHEGKVDQLNELEIIDGLIYANVYTEDYIVAIDPESGAVVKRIDLSGLLSGSDAVGVDYLNGIAYDEANDRIFVTGKLWPKLFEVRFIAKEQVQ